MKHFLLIMVLFTASCQSKPKDKLALAKNAIVTKIKESAHDWKSYEPVKWGKLDSSFTSLSDDSLYQVSMETFDDELKESESFNDRAKIWVSSFSSYGNSRFRQYLNEAKEHQAKAQEALDEMKKIEETFVSKFNGYKLAHSYRINNKSGHLEISHDLYYLDTSLKITKIKDISTDYYDKDESVNNK